MFKSYNGETVILFCVTMSLAYCHIRLYLVSKVHSELIEHLMEYGIRSVKTSSTSGSDIFENAKNYFVFVL